MVHWTEELVVEKLWNANYGIWRKRARNLFTYGLLWRTDIWKEAINIEVREAGDHIRRLDLKIVEILSRIEGVAGYSLVTKLWDRTFQTIWHWWMTKNSIKQSVDCKRIAKSMQHKWFLEIGFDEKEVSVEEDAAGKKCSQNEKVEVSLKQVRQGNGKFWPEKANKAGTWEDQFTIWPSSNDICWATRQNVMASKSCDVFKIDDKVRRRKEQNRLTYVVNCLRHSVSMDVFLAGPM